MAIKVGVSGFGRIARVVIRVAMDDKDIDICGINVRNADKEYMVYMLKYDTIFGRFPKELSVYDNGIVINGKRFLCTVKAMLLTSHGANAEQNTL